MSQKLLTRRHVRRCMVCGDEKKCRRLRGVSFRAYACPECALKYYQRTPYDNFRFLNQTGGMSVGAVIFFLCAYLLFCGATYWFVRTESSKATEAKALAVEAQNQVTAVEKKFESLRSEIRAGDDAIKTFIDTALKSDATTEDLKKKFEWIEMKLNNMPRHNPALPQKVVLTQETPFQVLYREARPKPKLKPLPEKTVKEKLIRDMKKKVNELSQ